jgi:hypothetical protein
MKYQSLREGRAQSQRATRSIKAAIESTKIKSIAKIAAKA